MARNRQDFAAQVKAFTDRAKRKQEVIFRTSAARVLNEANVPKGQGGRMPVDTGFLVNSSTAGKTPEAGQDPALVFATVEVGETVYAGWSAEYAMRQEFGFHGPDALGRVYAQEGNAFLRTSVQRWQEYVNDAAQHAEATVK